MVNKQYQVLLEIFVEKAIKQRMYTCRNHSNQVAKYKYQVMVAAHQDLMIPVKDDLEDVQGKPADPKGYDSRNQHRVDPLVLPDPALTFPLLVYFPITPAEADNNLQVADEGEAQRDTILQHKQGGGKEEPVHFGGPVLYTGHLLGVEVSGKREVLEGLMGEVVVGQEEGNRQQKGK